jgi:hypothetical protein
MTQDWENRFITELAECFDNSSGATALLAQIDVKHVFFGAFGTPSILDWWRDVVNKLKKGMGGHDGVSRLCRAAASIFAGNSVFANCRDPADAPDRRGHTGINVELRITGELPPDVLLAILQRLGDSAQTQGGKALINLGEEGSSRFNVTLEGLSETQVDDVMREVHEYCRERGVESRMTVEPYHFRDYYSDPLTAEGPDGQRFGLDRIRASTTVKDVARGIMNAYSDAAWPMSQGQRTQAVVNRVTPSGERHRLDPRDTLHDAGVRPGDVLNVSPERTAGAIDPNRREEALAKARNEVIDYVEAHPGFDMSANSLVAPTEYEFDFSAPSFGPPPAPGGPPVPIEHHRVLVELPADFPEQAPAAWWLTEIFHPNIHRETGYVCLGALKEHYVPGMDFGELCQMLVDLAAYRNYAVVEDDPQRPGALRGAALDTEAARWAMTPDGQRAIEARGGISLTGRMVLAGAPERRLRIRRVTP